MTTAGFGASPEPMQLDEALQKHLLLHAPRPEYPYEARARRKTGSGVYELKFDYETGHLREIHVVKGIEDFPLDMYAMATLKVWRAKPRSIHALLVPVTFTFSRYY
jgi:TonB family protein